MHSLPFPQTILRESLQESASLTASINSRSVSGVTKFSISPPAQIVVKSAKVGLEDEDTAEDSAEYLDEDSNDEN